MFLAEERDESAKKLFDDVLGVCIGRWLVGQWFRQDDAMIDKESQKQTSQDIEGDALSHVDVHTVLKFACQDYQQTLSGYDGDAIECGADAHEESLVFFI